MPLFSFSPSLSVTHPASVSTNTDLPSSVSSFSWSTFLPISSGPCPLSALSLHDTLSCCKYATFSIPLSCHCPSRRRQLMGKAKSLATGYPFVIAKHESTYTTSTTCYNSVHQPLPYPPTWPPYSFFPLHSNLPYAIPLPPRTQAATPCSPSRVSPSSRLLMFHQAQVREESHHSHQG